MVNELLNSFIQLLVAFIVSLISFETIKWLFMRPKINIQIYDLKNGNKAKIDHKYSLRLQKLFIHREKHYNLDLTGEEFVVLIENDGKSTAKSITLSGWIPSGWTTELTNDGDLIEKKPTKIKDWKKVMDGYFYPEEAGGKSFRISGDLLPTHVDYIKFNCEVGYELEFILAGDNIIHRKFKIEL
ncbi:MAG: hypothetical protein ACFFC7_33185 [Candidatus Hermodarchaeota archaeon]